MTIRYVDSVGGDDSDGLTWAKAYALLQSALTDWVSGDIIYMDESHTETVASTITYSGGTPAEPIPVYRVDNADDSYSPTTGSDTKNLRTSGSNNTMTFQNITLYGVYLDVNGYVTGTGGDVFSLIDCKLLELGNQRGLFLGGSNADMTHKFSNVTIDSATGNRALFYGGNYQIDSLNVDGTILSTGFVDFLNNRMPNVTFNNCDFSGITTAATIMVNCSAQGDSAFNVDFIGCKFPTPATSFALTDDTFANDGQFVTTWLTDQASDTYPLERQGYRGTIVTDTSTYHDNGWIDADQDTNLSHDMTSSSTCEIQAPLQGFDIVQWYDSTGTISVTVEAWDEQATNLQDDEAWMEVFYLDGTDVVVTLATTQIKAGNTTNNLSAGTGAASWTGEPGTGQSVKFEITGLTVGKKGYITARIYLGKASSTLFVDPIMTIA